MFCSRYTASQNHLAYPRQTIFNQQTKRSKYVTQPTHPFEQCFLLDIIAFDNKLLIKNLSRTAPVDYQCLADNGIPPRDTRTKRLLPTSKYLFLRYKLYFVSNEWIHSSIMTQSSKLRHKKKLFRAIMVACSIF